VLQRLFVFFDSLHAPQSKLAINWALSRFDEILFEKRRRELVQVVVRLRGSLLELQMV
jgi:hypothetical protein